VADARRHNRGSGRPTGVARASDRVLKTTPQPPVMIPCGTRETGTGGLPARHLRALTHNGDIAMPGAQMHASSAPY
jgi:hypothetical protein